MKPFSGKSVKLLSINLRHTSVVGQELLKGNHGGFYTPTYTVPCQPHGEAVVAPSSGAWCWHWHCLIALCKVLSRERSPAAPLLAQQHRLGPRARRICLPLCMLGPGFSAARQLNPAWIKRSSEISSELSDVLSTSSALTTYRWRKGMGRREKSLFPCDRCT